MSLVDEKGKADEKTKAAEEQVQEITSKLQQRGKGDGSVAYTQDEFEALHTYKMS